MKNHEILEHLTREDLTPDLQYIHDTLGMEAVKQLLQNCESMTLHVPKITSLKDLVKRFVRHKYPPGSNTLKIASELGVSKKFISDLGIWKKMMNGAG